MCLPATNPCPIGKPMPLPGTGNGSQNPTLGSEQTGTGDGSQFAPPPGTAQNGTNNGPKIAPAPNSGPDDATISPRPGSDAPGLPRGENP